MHGTSEPDELVYWRERATQAERERDALVTRRDELLATIAKLTRDVPYPEEANAANVLIAEVGTLRAQLATVTRDRDAALREAERLRHSIAIEGDFVCPNELAATNLTAENARLRKVVEAACEWRASHHTGSQKSSASMIAAIDTYRAELAKEGT